MYQASLRAARRAKLAIVDNTNGAAPITAPCNFAALGGGNATLGATLCNDDYTVLPYAGDYAEGASLIGNMDFFQSPTQAYTANGRSIASFYASGSRNNSYYIYNVHSTPNTVVGTPTAPAAIVSWSVGMPTSGNISTVWPSSTPPPTGLSGAFVSASAPPSSVWLSTTSYASAAFNLSSQYTIGPVSAVALQYLRNYTTTTQQCDPSGKKCWGVPAQNVFLSAPLYHAVVSGLAPATTYYYVVGSAAGYSIEFSFKTAPAPNSVATYPFVVGLMADIGQTANTSLAMTNMVALKPNVVLNAGDLACEPAHPLGRAPCPRRGAAGCVGWVASSLTRRPAHPRADADNFMMCNVQTGANFAQWVLNGTFIMYPEPGGFGAWWTCQMRWDSWLSVPGTQALFGSAQVIHSAGNHEVRGTACQAPSQRFSPPQASISFFICFKPRGRLRRTTPAPSGRSRAPPTST